MKRKIKLEENRMKNVFARISELLDNPSLTKEEICNNGFLDEFCKNYNFPILSETDMALEDFIENNFIFLEKSEDPVEFLNSYELEPSFGHLDFSSDWFFQVYFSNFPIRIILSIFMSYYIRPDILTKYSDIIEKKINNQNEITPEKIWIKLSMEQTLEDKFIRKEWKYLDHLSISYTQTLTEKFMEDFRDDLDWSILCSRQKFSIDFIKRNKDTLKLMIDFMESNKDLGLSKKDIKDLLK